MSIAHPNFPGRAAQFSIQPHHFSSMHFLWYNRHAQSYCCYSHAVLFVCTCALMLFWEDVKRREIMELPAILTIIRTDSAYRFRLDLPDAPVSASQEYTTEQTPEIRERLRRLLQAAAQYMQATLLAGAKRQSLKINANNDALPNLGRFLFATLLPPSIQDALRRLDVPLVLNANTPDIPWELLCEGSGKN